jgi:methylase of polypeptide subunit release factors
MGTYRMNRYKMYGKFAHTMKTYTLLENTCRDKLPTQFCLEEEIRMPEMEVEFFLKKYTKPGDKILDIFAGFGTTLRICEEMERIPFGIEYDEAKWEFTRNNLNEINKDNIIHGDSREILNYNLPQMDFLITSPPFTKKEDKFAPLTAYESEGTYSEYLQGIHNIFFNLRNIIKPDGYLLVEVGNMKNPETQSVTTLAWDVGREISKSHHFLGETVVVWNVNSDVEESEGSYGYGYDHSYCLIFRNSLI